jgi:hypothetical protein
MMLPRKANPTFWATVDIPVPGDKACPLELEYRHRRRSEAIAFRDSLKGRSDDEIVLDMVVGWKWHEPFSAEALLDLLQEYPASPEPIAEAYFRELATANRKNS